MKIKKRNGFTLVELLVTIALMLTILGIAIVSVVNVNNNKKQEAWNLVKEQIETAAEDYFTANEYLFEGLTDDQNSNAQISVGTLVKEDYLNKVTNPVTGEEISSCSIVNVKKRRGVLTATFDEGTINSELTECDDTKDITISDVPKKDIPLPDFDVSYFKDSNCSSSVSADSTGWFNINKLGENKPLYVKVSPKEGSKVSNVEVNVGGNVIQSYNKLNDGAYCVQLADEGDVSYDVTAYGPGGNKTIGSSYQKDTERPVYSYRIGYKVYNIKGELCSENSYRTKNGITCGTTNGYTYLKWENKEIGDSNYKLSNIYMFELTFPNIVNDVGNNIDFYIGSGNTLISNKCIRIGDNTYRCGSDTDNLSSTVSVDKVEIRFYNKNLDYVDHLDGSGLQLFAEYKSSSNNGSIDLKNNYQNQMRLRSACSDSVSGCYENKAEKTGYKMQICYNRGNQEHCEDITEGQYTLVFGTNTNPIIRNENGNISSFSEEEYTIRRYDVAGNESTVTLNTKGKFN